MNDPWSNRHVPSFVSNRTPDDDTASDHFGLVCLLVKEISELGAEVAKLRAENERLGANPLQLLESLIREATQPQKGPTDADV